MAATSVLFYISSFSVNCTYIDILYRHHSPLDTSLSFTVMLSYIILHDFSLSELTHICSVLLEESDKAQSTLYLGLTREDFPCYTVYMFVSHFFFRVFCRRNYGLFVCVCGFSLCAPIVLLYLIYFCFHFVIISDDFQLCARGLINWAYVYILLLC